jgi:hypothetical protein
MDVFNLVSSDSFFEAIPGIDRLNNSSTIARLAVGLAACFETQLKLKKLNELSKTTLDANIFFIRTQPAVPA